MMDESEREIETLLRRMPLRHPPPAMDERVAAVLRPSGRTSPAWRWGALAAGLVLAGGITAGLLWHRKLPPNEPQQTPSAVVVGSAMPSAPVSASRTVSHIVNDGVIGSWDDAPLQRIRRISVRQLVVIDPATGQRLNISVPQEEIVVMRRETF